jgi:hypothetical protein
MQKTNTVVTAEWMASVTGLVGAALVASNTSFAGYGFVAYLLSNLGWLYYGLRTKTRSMVLMQIGFLATTALGIKNWLLV